MSSSGGYRGSSRVAGCRYDGSGSVAAVSQLCNQLQSYPSAGTGYQHGPPHTLTHVHFVKFF